MITWVHTWSYVIRAPDIPTPSLQHPRQSHFSFWLWRKISRRHRLYLFFHQPFPYQTRLQHRRERYHDYETPLKGVPARESRTGTRLVSPAKGGEKKKKRPLRNRASECRIEYIRNTISIHRCYGVWYSSRKACNTRKRVKKTYPSINLPYLDIFFLASTNSYKTQTIWLKT